MPETRAVYDQDWDFLLIQHREAFAMMSTPIILRRFDPSSTTKNIYDEAVVVGTLPDQTVQAIIEIPKTIDEMQKVFGIVDRPDYVVYLSTVLLSDAGLWPITNRDRLFFEGKLYDIIGNLVQRNMGNRILEVKFPVRAVT